ncbi:MAG: hypothetical protein ACRDY0_11645 [Acidimicrobiales bacterium]
MHVGGQVVGTGGCAGVITSPTEIVISRGEQFWVGPTVEDPSGRSLVPLLRSEEPAVVAHVSGSKTMATYAGRSEGTATLVTSTRRCDEPGKEAPVPTLVADCPVLLVRVTAGA